MSVLPANKVAGEWLPKVGFMDVYPPSVGTSVAAVGFPKTKLDTTKGIQGLGLGLNPSVTTGRVTAVYEDHRDLGMLDFPCFEIATHVFGGMSGGPVYNETGRLCGIVCASMEGHPTFYAVTLWPALNIRLTHNPDNTPLEPAFYFGQLAKTFLNVANVDEVPRRQYVDRTNPDRPRLRLKPLV